MAPKKWPRTVRESAGTATVENNPRPPFLIVDCCTFTLRAAQCSSRVSGTDFPCTEAATDTGGNGVAAVSGFDTRPLWRLDVTAMDEWSGAAFDACCAQ